MQKKFLSILLSIIMMLGCSTQVLAASDPAEGNMGTFEEVDEGIYEFRDADGTLLATFVEDNSIKMPRGSWTIDWTLDSNSSTYGTNQFNVSAGDVFTVDISFSTKGLTYIGVYNRSTSSYVWAENTETNRFKGTVKIETGSALVSFALKNASSSQITYTGSYNFWFELKRRPYEKS